MPITLTPEQEAMLDTLVARGDYPNADAALDGIFFHIEEAAKTAAKLQRLRDTIDEGYADADAGRVVPTTESTAWDRLKKLRDRGL